jgi:transcriptional regulator with XRE-family HTH domain
MSDLDADARALGRRLTHRRQELGLTQGEVAERLGQTSPESVGRYERGERDPRFSTLYALARALECTVADLLVDTGPPLARRVKRMPRERGTLAGPRPLSREQALKELTKHLDRLREQDEELGDHLMLVLLETAWLFERRCDELVRRDLTS